MQIRMIVFGRRVALPRFLIGERSRRDDITTRPPSEVAAQGAENLPSPSRIARDGEAYTKPPLSELVL